jgi:hypothetical protein
MLLINDSKIEPRLKFNFTTEGVEGTENPDSEEEEKEHSLQQEVS